MNGDIFWKTGILTLIIFIIGMLFGMWLDQLRVEEFRKNLEEVLLTWNDLDLYNFYYRVFPEKDCNQAIEENIKFGDKVYYTLGKMLEEYEKVNKFSPELLAEKKRYVLLKLQFWFNSIYLKESCNASYVNVVYFYSQYDLNPIIEENQKAQSLVLTELKNEYGNKIILIPLPIDIDIMTIELVKNRFNITSAPTILINEKIKLEGLRPKQELKEILESIFLGTRKTI